MTPQENPAAPDSPVSPEMESLFEAVSEKKPTAQKGEPSQVTGPRTVDFRNPMLLSPSVLRKLRQHEDQFVNALASRLSLYLRSEFTLALTGVETISFRTLSQGWENPTHLTLFKIEPLRGISLLEITPSLGLCMVDRLMGGPGQVDETSREISDIERALLEQVIQIMLGEWSNGWAAVKELKPAILGHETNGNFVQTAPAETIMLVMTLDAQMGDNSGRIQFAFPHAALEPLIQQGCGSPEQKTETTPKVAPSPAVSPKWNVSLENVEIPLTLEWHDLKIKARDIVQLKVGDVLQLNGQGIQTVRVRLADRPKFHGRLGTINGQWAAELNEVIKID